MPHPAVALSSGGILTAILLGGPSLLLWAIDLSLLRSQTGSDPFGDGMAQAFAVIATILLWLLLGAFILTAAIGGGVPPLALVAALLLIPASGAAAVVAAQLLIRRQDPPFLWPLLVPGLVPPLVVGFGLWALLPPLRLAVPAVPLSVLVWALVLAASLAILPMRRSRRRFDDAAAAATARAEAALAALPEDAPVWDLVPFLSERHTGMVDLTVRDRLRLLERRQGDVETMLARGDFPFALLGLPVLELSPTPSLCAVARAALTQRAAVLSATPAEPSYRSIGWEADNVIGTLEWLARSGCACKGEAQAWQALLARYPDVGWDSYRLAALL